MTPAVHGKHHSARCALRALLIAGLAGTVLFAIFAARTQGDREQSARAAIAIEQSSNIGREQKFLNLQNSHAFPFPVYKVTDIHLAMVAKSPWLEELRLGDTSITDGGIRHLTALRSLRVLKLSRTAISDRSLAYLASLTKLEMLDLDHTRITDNGVSKLSALGALRVLQLANTKISDEALVHISRFDSLEDLYLSGDRISDNGLRLLARLPKLEYLDLRATSVTDDGLMMLRCFPALEVVRLDNCDISDAGILELAAVETLELADLYAGKAITAAGIARLQELRPSLTICWDKEGR